MTVMEEEKQTRFKKKIANYCYFLLLIIVISGFIMVATEKTNQKQTAEQMKISLKSSSFQFKD